MLERRTTQKTAWAAVAALLPTAGGLAFPSTAGGKAADPNGETSEPDGVPPARAAADAAELYTQDYGVGVEEARRRLASQDGLSAALSRLGELAGERFAGTWIEHEPRFRGVIRLTGPVADAEAFETVIEESPAPIEVRADARFSSGELAAEQAKVQDELDELVPGASTSTDPRRGSVVAYLPDETAGSDSLDSDPAATLQALTDAPVSLRYDPPGGTHQVYGGDWLGTVGQPAPTCTNGFSVTYDPPGGDGPIDAVLTAGHCLAGPGVSLPSLPNYEGDFYLYHYLDQDRDSDSDIGVHWGEDQPATSVPESAEPEFYGVSQNPADRSTVTSITQRTNQTVGTFVCHQGATTNYSCGEIVANNTTTCYSAPTCDPVWVRVEGENLVCFGGDSGGPWFAGSSAYGLHHGGPENQPTPADCSFAIYTAIDKKAQVNSFIVLG